MPFLGGLGDATNDESSELRGGRKTVCGCRDPPVTPKADYELGRMSRGGIVRVVKLWVVKIAATTLGETRGDWATMSLNVGYLVPCVESTAGGER
jgi:hypothetical protein